MAKLTLAEQLDAAIRETAAAAELSSTNWEVAKAFYHDQRNTIAPFIEDWAIEKLSVLIGKNRVRNRRKRSVQLQFEIDLGIRFRPRKLIVKDNREIPRYDATITDWREFRSYLLEHHLEKEAADKAIALMEKYAPDHRGITYREVLEREAAKTK